MFSTRGGWDSTPSRLGEVGIKKRWRDNWGRTTTLMPVPAMLRRNCRNSASGARDPRDCAQRRRDLFARGWIIRRRHATGAGRTSGANHGERAVVADPGKAIGSGLLWYSGTARDSQDTLEFSLLSGVHPMIEKYPLGEVAEAYELMHSGKARFRVVLTMGV